MDTPKETPKIVKIRKPRQPRGTRDKTIKIKLTAKKNKAKDNEERHVILPEDEDEEPEAAIEEHMIFRVPEGDMCNRLHELVKKREIPEDVKIHFKGKIKQKKQTLDINLFKYR